MTDHKADKKGQGALSDLIKKEIRSETNRSLLCRMQAFRPERDLPDRLVALLGEIDRAERTS